MKATWNKDSKAVEVEIDFDLDTRYRVLVDPIEARKLIIEIRNALMDGGCHLKGRVKIVDDEQVYNLIKSGKSYREVAKLHLCSVGAVQTACKRYEAKLK